MRKALTFRSMAGPHGYVDASYNALGVKYFMESSTRQVRNRHFTSRQHGTQYCQFYLTKLLDKMQVVKQNGQYE